MPAAASSCRCGPGSRAPSASRRGLSTTAIPRRFTPFEKTCTTFGVPALLLEMVDRFDPIPVKGTTSYPIGILNQGSAQVTNIRLEATVPAGMEFVRASGPGNKSADYSIEGKTIVFEPVATLDPGAKLEFEVFTRALAPGDLRFKIKMTADQLKEGGPVTEEESTTVYSEERAANAKLAAHAASRGR